MVGDPRQKFTSLSVQFELWIFCKNDLDISSQARTLKKTTKRLSLQDMFWQKRLSSSVN